LSIASTAIKQIISVLEKLSAAAFEAKIVPAVANMIPDKVFAMVWA
jgi:hypothetical protein